jgi:hypothetical protein
MKEESGLIYYKTYFQDFLTAMISSRDCKALVILIFTNYSIFRYSLRSAA